jgi:elongation factor P
MTEDFMQINATQIRVGNILIIDGELYRVTWNMHRTPGKGNACMQTKLKNIINGRNLEKRFLSSERVEIALLESKSMQYLYNDSEGYIFMDNETYEQLTVKEDVVGDMASYLKDNESYILTFYNGSIMGVEFPKTMILTVIQAPPEIKKATTNASFRPVTLENGMVVLGPGFLKEGDKIKVNTETNEYVERVKE